MEEPPEQSTNNKEKEKQVEKISQVTPGVMTRHKSNLQITEEEEEIVTLE